MVKLGMVYYCFTNTNANSYEFVEPAKGIEREDLNSLQEPPNTPNKTPRFQGYVNLGLVGSHSF